MSELRLMAEQNDFDLCLSFFLPAFVSSSTLLPPTSLVEWIILLFLLCLLHFPLTTLICFIWPSLFWKTNSAARQPEDKIAVVDAIVTSDCNCSGAAMEPDVCSLPLSPVKQTCPGSETRWVLGKKIKGLSTQQKVFINHCISTACFRIILLEHIQESDIWKKDSSNSQSCKCPWLRFSIGFKFKYKDSPFLSQVQFQRMTLNWECISSTKFRTLNKPHPHNKIVRYMEV